MVAAVWSMNWLSNSKWCMLRGEHKAPSCTERVVVKPGRKIEAVAGDDVDTLDNRPKEPGEGRLVASVVTVESAMVATDGREFGTEDDRVVLDDKGW
jgi:hypothetical protein